MKPANIVGMTLLCASLWPGLVPTAVASDADKYEDKCNHTDVLINEDGSKPSAAQYALKERLDEQCREDKAKMHKKAVSARVTLKKKYHIDASGMTDREAVYRLEKEEEDAKQAREQAKERREQEAASQREKQMNSIMKQQNNMMKSMGIDLPSGGGSDDDQGAADDDKMQEQMYRKMVDGGAAPQCKGKKGDALIKCVDAAMDAGQ